MKQYLLSMHVPEGDPPPELDLEKVMQEVNAWNEEARAAGVWVFGGALHPASTATVVRIQEGEMLTTDGPYLEGKEHIGGFDVIAAPDLDAALEWARKLAVALIAGGAGGAGLPIEVRPFYGDAESAPDEIG